MIIVRNLGFSKGSLALGHHSRAQVREALSSLNIRPALHFGVWRLRGLEKPQYDAFMRVLESLSVKHSTLTLKLPSLSEMRRIDFNRLFESSAGMDELKSRCVLPNNRPVIDLADLSFIYREYVLTQQLR